MLTVTALEMYKIRLAIFGLLFFFLQAGVVAAYARCLGSGKYFGSEAESPFVTQYLECHEDLRVYTIAQAQNSSSKDYRIKGAPSWQRVSYPSVTDNTYLSWRTPLFSLLSLFPYRSISIYQFKAVYRI